MDNQKADELAGMRTTVGDGVARRGNGLSQWLGRAMLRLMGWTVQGPIANVPKMVMIGAPHTSNMDGVLAIATLTAYRLRAGTMIKDTAFKGVMGPILRWFGAIPINRRAAGGVVGASVGAFRDNEKLILLIAPEGTRSNAEEWKRGFHLIAASAGVPILPAAIDYVRKRITFCPPVYTTDDYESDLARILEFYRLYGSPRHPERASAPICRALGLPIKTTTPQPTA
ncbi:MAG: lysophospholipid acyltransferase family protein [Rhodoblastus sp.]|nr:lysophospholipid acyltransferase family protein [Rhodoblastus sp.]